MTINLLPITWIIGLVVTGMSFALLGSIKVPLAKHLNLDEARIGGLVSTFGLAMIPVMLVMGFLTDLLDKQMVLVAGSLLITGSLLLFSLARNYLMAWLAVLLLSTGWSGLASVLTVLMQVAFGGSHTHAMNFGNFFFGVGAFITPVLITFWSRRIGFTGVIYTLTCITLLPGMLVLGIDFASLATASGDQADPGMGTLLSNPFLWLTALALLFYMPMEATMSAWATTYLKDKQVSDTAASALLSGFWLAFTISRLGVVASIATFPWLAGETGWLIIGLSFFCLLVWLGVVLSQNQVVSCIMVLFSGLAFGPVFPTIIGVLIGHVHPSVAGRAVGLFFMIGGIGWSVLPMLIGARARRRGVQQAFWIAVGSATGLTMTGIVLRWFLISAT